MSTNPQQMSLSVGAWARGISYEVDFWSNWSRTKGGNWPDDFQARLVVDREFDETLQKYLPEHGVGAVLDVGAGPLTSLGAFVKGKPLSVTAVDPLAPLYDRILEQEKLVAPVKTEFANAEDLSCFFANSQFDLVHCRNALDHSFDPLRGIEEMLRVVRVGGHVVLRHFADEAKAENYSGFHQFNFCERQNRFCIWNNKGEFFPDQILSKYGSFALGSDPNAVEVVIIKTAEFDDDPNLRNRKRIREIMQGVITYFSNEVIRAE